MHLLQFCVYRFPLIKLLDTNLENPKLLHLILNTVKKKDNYFLYSWKTINFKFTYSFARIISTPQNSIKLTISFSSLICWLSLKDEGLNRSLLKITKTTLSCRKTCYSLGWGIFWFSTLSLLAGIVLGKAIFISLP